MESNHKIKLSEKKLFLWMFVNFGQVTLKNNWVTHNNNQVTLNNNRVTLNNNQVTC